MKGYEWILIIVGIAIVWMFILPPSIRCKLYFWNKNKCSEIEGLLKAGGLDPNMPAVTQLDELAELANQ